MPNKRDLKKHFEAIVGHDLAGGFGDVVTLREAVGLYSTEQGNATSHELVFNGGFVKRCNPAPLLTVGGLSFVGASGEAVVLLSNFHCERVNFRQPVIVVATPRTASAVFVTAVPTIIDNGNDVRIELHTWAAGGAPAPNILVTWYCRLQFIPVIL
jgi:hypothetical protein